MKSLYFSYGIIGSVIVFLGINYFILNSVFDFTKKELEKIQENIGFYENITDEDISRIRTHLENVREKWEKKESYLCMSLEHDVNREFLENIMSAISFFNSQEYPEFIDKKMSAFDTLEHMIYDEGFRLGNFF